MGSNSRVPTPKIPTWARVAIKTPLVESAGARFARSKTCRPPCDARCYDATDTAVRCQAARTQISWTFITSETREDGGGNDAENLVTLCSAHHRACHRGELIVQGSVDRADSTHRVAAVVV